ncbi:NAD(P)H-hydrate dehydratase, partial [Pseudomonas aeruginosa]
LVFFFQALVVLKGSGSLFAVLAGRFVVCSQGHPVMVGAGLGDVLSGITGAFLVHCLEAFEAVCLAVWLYVAAGERLGAQGLAGTYLIPTVRQLLEECSPCLK